MIFLDTCALLWWSLDPNALSQPAKAICAEMEERGGYASSISIWEIGTKVKRGKLDLGISVSEFARRIEQSGVVELVSVDLTTWLKSLSLDWEHRDPADRVIVATALLLGLPILTKDALMRTFRGVQTVW